MARMGRPKLENPRSEGVFIRLTKDEHTDITEYASSHDLTIDVYKRQAPCHVYSMHRFPNRIKQSCLRIL